MMDRNRHVYVMSNGADLVKIGISRSLDQRVKAHPGVHLAWATPIRSDAPDVEKAAHTALLDRRVAGEWFQVPVSDAVAAISDAVAMVEAGDMSSCRRLPPARAREAPPKQAIGCRLPADAREALYHAGRADRRSMSDMGRKIITDWLKANGRLKERQS